MCNRKGISLVALIITIIVLIILVSAIMISGVKTPANAQLAVFYNNVTTIQDAINMKMLENMQKYANDSTKDMDRYKWEGILKEYNPAMAEPIFIIHDGSYNNNAVCPISQSMKQIINIEEKVLDKYAVDERGIVYHKGFENDNKIYYNRKESSDKINSYNINIDSNIQNGTVVADKITGIAEGENVTLTITVEEGYEIISLIVDGENVTPQIVNNEYVIEMPKHNIIVTADIQEIATYTITINPITNGTITANKTTEINANEVITLTTTVVDGYTLTALVVDGIDVTDEIVNNEYAFSMPAHDVTVDATIAVTTYNVLIDNEITNGTVTASKATGILPNETVTLTMTPTDGYVLQSLIIDGTNVFNLLTGNQYIITVTNHDVTVDATFVLNSFNVIIDPNITNGTVTADKTTGVASGEVVILTITANTGYKLQSLYINGNDITGYNGFYMPPSDVNITAIFEEQGAATILVSSGVQTGDLINFSATLTAVTVNWRVYGFADTNSDGNADKVVIFSTAPMGGVSLYGVGGYNNAFTQIDTGCANAIATTTLEGCAVRGIRNTEYNYLKSYISIGTAFWIGDQGMYYVSNAQGISYVDTSGNIQICPLVLSGGYVQQYGYYLVLPIVFLPEGCQTTGQDGNGVWQLVF